MMDNIDINFNSFGLDKDFIDNLSSLGYITPTPIQKATISHVLNGKDIIAKAKTGSGKTLAFAIGIVNSLNISTLQPQALVLVPTRELGKQVLLDIKKVAKYRQNTKTTLLIGGEPLKAQATAISKGTHIIVATPGRLLDHLQKQSLDIKKIKTLVLDEADKMLDMGFLEDIQKITRNMKNNRQTLLFSAIFSNTILKLSQTIQKDAISIEVDSVVDKLQEYYINYHEDKYHTLVTLLSYYRPQKAVLFCTMKVTVDEISDRLYSDGFSSISLQGDLDQISRDENLIKFSSSCANILVATDIASRGLDIDGVDLVINYDFPKDLAQYTHRIGRTGRINKSGVAVTLLKQSQVFGEEFKDKEIQKLTIDIPKVKPYQAKMSMLAIKRYKKQKIRAGDIVGTLTKTKELLSNDIGDITITSSYAYVAILDSKIKIAHLILQNNKIKGMKFKSYILAD